MRVPPGPCVRFLEACHQRGRHHRIFSILLSESVEMRRYRPPHPTLSILRIRENNQAEMLCLSRKEAMSTSMWQPAKIVESRGVHPSILAPASASRTLFLLPWSQETPTVRQSLSSVQRPAETTKVRISRESGMGSWPIHTMEAGPGPPSTPRPK